MKTWIYWITITYGYAFMIYIIYPIWSYKYVLCMYLMIVHTMYIVNLCTMYDFKFTSCHRAKVTVNFLVKTALTFSFILYGVWRICVRKIIHFWLFVVKKLVWNVCIKSYSKQKIILSCCWSSYFHTTVMHLFGINPSWILKEKGQ